MIRTRAEGSWIAAATGQLLGGTSFHSLDSDRADGRERGTAGLADIANLHRTDAQTGPLGQALRAHLARCVTWQRSPQKYAVVKPGNTFPAAPACIRPSAGRPGSPMTKALAALPAAACPSAPNSGCLACSARSTRPRKPPVPSPTCG
jgi:hypothetical protein